MKRILSFVTLFFLALGIFYPGSVGQAASASKAIAPASLTTLTGSRLGGVANLAAQDQSGSADNPAKYVSFTTPGTIYKGYRQFTLPVSIAISSITAMTVKVNYKGPAQVGQRWSWFLYDWTAAKWVLLGDNASATTNIWKVMTFSAASPKRFVNASRAIRVSLQSNNATGNAKLDFESVNVTYTTPEVSSVVYGDALLNGWGDWSWGDVTHNLGGTSPAHGGSKAISVTYGSAGWSGLQFGRNDPFSISAYNTLRFWVHGGASGGQTIQVQVSDGTTTLTKNIIPTANTWTQVNMSLAACRREIFRPVFALFCHIFAPLIGLFGQIQPNY